MQCFRRFILLPRVRSGPSLSKTMMSTSGFDQIKLSFEESEQIAVIRLNDPSRMNAINVGMGDEIVQVVQDLKAKSGLRAAVLTGEGRAFTAGGDYSWLLSRHSDTEANNKEIMLNFYQKPLSLRQLPVPVIAAINGPAIGAGFSIAVGGCDIRVAHTKAKMGMTFVKLGIHPGMAASHFLPNLIGSSRAAELLLTGRIIGATEALDMGIVSRVSDDPLSDALSIARDICKAAPQAVSETVKTLRSGQEKPRDFMTSINLEATAQSKNYATTDFKEGVEALQEKREPQFKGE